MASSRKQIVITGVSRGLGKSLAERFAELGHVVHGCGRGEAELQELKRKPGSPHTFARVDVADPGAVAAWAGQVLSECGAPDLLINNAAIINRNARLWEFSAEEIQAIVDINIVGVVNVIRHFVPAMVARASGVVVNLSSGWGRSVASEVAPYCATKWAIEGLTRALAQELPKNMAAVPLNPGIIDTRMLRSCFGAGASAYIGPDEWSRIAAPFLLKIGPEHTGKPLIVPGQ